MSNTSGQKDPSMDEILGSIRRIITEDAQSGQPAAAVDPEADEDEIMELTDEVGDSDDDESHFEMDMAPVQSLSEMGGGDDSYGRREPLLEMPPPDDAPEPEPLATIGVTPMAEFAAMDDVPAAEPETVELAPSMFGAAPHEEEPAMAKSDISEESASGETPVAGGDMTSNAASMATATALGELSRAMDEKMNRLRLGEGDVTVSDMVKEMIRPMLSQWIDQNLPGVVERVVRREIQKLVDRTEDGD